MADNKEMNFFKRASSFSDMDMASPASPFVKPASDLSFSESTLKAPSKGTDAFSKKPAGKKKSPAPSFAASPAKKKPQLTKIATEATKFLENSNLPQYSDGIRAIMAEAKSQKFTVSVVGEFSRGKSTFINKLLGKEVLPVANMPTTAMLTRIRYSTKEGISIFDAERNTKKALPLSLKSWENYIADDSGNDPNGVAFVNIDSPWLKNGIEIVDTPGAGDLEEKRARLIGDALKSSDAAIITISALSALSMSEKLFIEERLISKKTPFLMLIITKLDQVDIGQRSGVISYIKEKLKMWKFSGIDVFIPYEVDMPDTLYDSVIGMDKVISKINSWISSSDRKKLTREWTALKLKAHLNSVIEYAKEQKYIFEESDLEKKNELIEKKNRMLEKADAAWDDAKTQMLKKGDECYDAFISKTEEFKRTLIEKMQYEISHISNPQKWWNEDFPYKLKIEMTNLSNIVESLVSRAYTRDAAWFNAVLEKNFKTSVLVSSEDVADREHYTSFDASGDIHLGDLTKSRNLGRIGITALSIGAAMVCSTIGIMPIFATMGIGTGGSILSEAIFKNKTESQKKILKDEIEKRIPGIVDNAISYSESRIKAMYNNVIKEATKQQDSWAQSQKDVIESASKKKTDDHPFDADAIITEMKKLCAKIDEI